MRRLAWLLASVIFTALYTAQLPVTPVGEDPRSAALANSRPVGPFELTNAMDGNRFTRQDLLERWSLVYTGYVNCPDICPTTLGALARVAAQSEGQFEQPPQLLFVSMDPQRDSASRLASYVEYFSAQVTPLRAPLPQLTKFAQAFGWLTPQPRTPITAGTIAHSPSVALVNPQAHITHWFRQPIDEQQVLQTLTTVITKQDTH